MSEQGQRDQRGIQKTQPKKKRKEGGVTETGKAESLKRKAQGCLWETPRCGAHGCESRSLYSSWNSQSLPALFPVGGRFSGRPQLSGESGFLSLGRLVLRWH